MSSNVSDAMVLAGWRVLHSFNITSVTENVLRDMYAAMRKLEPEKEQEVYITMRGGSWRLTSETSIKMMQDGTAHVLMIPLEKGEDVVDAATRLKLVGIRNE